MWCRKVGSARGEDGGDIEETVHQLTLDEWRALKTDRQPTSSGFNIRRPGEGCTSDPAWTGMHVLKKKDDVDVVGRSGKFDDAVSVLSLSLSLSVFLCPFLTAIFFRWTWVIQYQNVSIRDFI